MLTCECRIHEDAWTTIEYTDAVFDEASRRWISRAEVAGIDFVAFAGQRKTDRVPGRLVVRRSYHRQAARIRAQYDETACRAPRPA